MEVTLDLHQGYLKKIYFCPDYRGECCCVVEPGQESQVANTDGGFRKPDPGMLILAMETHGFEPSQCLMVGDRLKDQQAAIAANVIFMRAHEWRKGKIVS